MRSVMMSGLGAMCLVLTACPKENDDPVTYDEARQSLEESSVSSQASELTTSSVELTTNFTIGSAVKDAASELRTFIGSQLPCADIALDAAKLTVKYGAKPGNCTYRGHTFAGTHIVEVARNDDGDVEVDHTWSDFSNGIVKVSGTAHVVWSKKDVSRHVVHELTWTRLADGLQGTGKGDRTQRPLAGDLTKGIEVDGSRSWDGKSGHWDLGIAGVEMRWADPCPQAGTYTLSTPKKKTLSVSFSRVDDDHIQVTLASGAKSFKFTVARAGQVSDA
jgi:hypothetical protein